jgi:hypothetical protein
MARAQKKPADPPADQLVLTFPEDRPEPDVNPFRAERKRLERLWWSTHPTETRKRGAQFPTPEARG